MDPLWLALVEAARRYARVYLADEAVAISLTLARFGATGPWPLPPDGWDGVTAAVSAHGFPPAVRPAVATGQDNRTAAPDTSPAAGQDTPDLTDLTPTAADILAVLARAERPLKGQAIANRSRHDYNPYFRQMLANLVEAGHVVKPDGGGYWPANRPFPSS